MKKLLSLAIALLMCVAVFASCAAGKTAYELAVEHGFEGTEEEWRAYLRGEDGKDGEDGKPGADGQNGQNGQNGTNGTDGVNGTNGTDGTDGEDGKDGKDGITPLIRPNPETKIWEYSCDEGKTWTSLGILAYGEVTINEDGYFCVNGVNTGILATVIPSEDTTNPDIEVDMATESIELYTLYVPLTKEGQTPPVLQIKAKLKSGRTAYITISDSMITSQTKPNFAVAGEYKITVSYMGCTTTGIVTVLENAIKTEADFLAMQPDGEYYIANDLTVTKTYEGTFKGVLLGGDRVITTSVPLFNELDATITNLVIAGEVKTDAPVVGALANTVLGGEYKNIVNKAEVTGADMVGGLVGETVEGCEAVFTACTNNGTVNGVKYVGGLVGYLHTGSKVAFNNCVNNGAVTGTGTTNEGVRDGVGGIVGAADAQCENVFTGCVNNGTILGEVTAAGILAFASSNAKLTFVDCKNTGTITCNVRQAGGIAAWIRGDVAVSGCENSGNVTGLAHTGGIVAYVDGEGTFEKCKNTATVISIGDGVGGIVAVICFDGKITDCHNTGYVEGSLTSNVKIGGVVGWVKQSATVVNCTNSGDVKGKYRVAGIISWVDASSTIDHCFNSGKITSTGNAAAGIISTMGQKNPATNVIKFTGNTGEIVGGGQYSAGIAAYCLGNDGAGSTNEFLYCYNTGKVTTAIAQIGGILGYTNNTTKAKFVGCFNIGEIAGTKGMNAALYFSNFTADMDADCLKGNFYLEGSAEFDHVVKTQGYELNAASIITKADIASGKLCYLLNEAIGEDIYFQTLGKDELPVFDKDHGKVVLEGGVLKNEGVVVSTKDVIDAAYALKDGESLAGESTLIGVITKIDTAYSEQYKNVSFTIVVEGLTDKPIQAYRATGDDAADVTVGDTVTVTGTLTNYRGTIQFAAGGAIEDFVAHTHTYEAYAFRCDICNAIAAEHTEHKDSDKNDICDGCGYKFLTTPEEILNAAYELAKGATLEGGPYTLKGTIVSVDTVYSAQYGNVTVTINVYLGGGQYKTIQCYRVKGEGADVIGVGDDITVTGNITNYNGTIEFAQGCTLDAYTLHTHAYTTLANKCDICGLITDHTCVDADTSGKCDLCDETVISLALKGTLSFASKDNRTEYSKEKQVWVGEGITLTNDKGSSTSNVGDYANPARFYKSSTVKIEFAGIKMLVIDCGASKYATALEDSITDANVTVTVDGSVVTIEFASEVTEFTFTCSGGQTRFQTLEVYA